jgi:hypothetical protein
MFDRRIFKAGRGEAGERLFLIASLVRFRMFSRPRFPSLAVVALSVLMRESFREMEVLHQSARRDRFQR